VVSTGLGLHIGHVRRRRCEPVRSVGQGRSNVGAPAHFAASAGSQNHEGRSLKSAARLSHRQERGSAAGSEKRSCDVRRLEYGRRSSFGAGWRGCDVTNCARARLQSWRYEILSANAVWAFEYAAPDLGPKKRPGRRADRTVCSRQI